MLDCHRKIIQKIGFKKKFQHTDVPADYPNDQPLGSWVQEQRNLYREGTLDKDRHELLEGKGFIFEPGTNVSKTLINEAWTRNYKELIQFQRDHGHLEVSCHIWAVKVYFCPSALPRQWCAFGNILPSHTGAKRLQSN